MNISVVLDKITPYTPGETVTGKVLFVKTTEPSLAKPQGLKIQFKGKSFVRFNVIDNFNVKGRWRTHTNSEYYFNSSKFLLGNGTYDVPELSETGIREYPFCYRLPGNIPSSYKGTHGSVEYSITVTLKRSWGVNKEVVHAFNVNGELDLGNHPQARQGAGAMNVRRSEKVGMLWWSGTVFVNLNLRKKCYLPGEFVLFSAQIINDSKSKIHKAKLLLTQECRYYAQGGSHTVTHVIKKVKGPGVQPGESSVTWENNTLLKIPPLPPSNLGGLCRLIEINYFVHLIVQPSSLAWKDKTIVCKLPLTLGTKRGSNSRQSYPNSTTGSLVFGNRVGNIFGSRTTSPRGTLDSSATAEMSYYQNVVFPLARCFSAPVYENCRVSRSLACSPQTLNLSQGFVEEQEDERYEPPPTYEEAMRIVSRMSSRGAEDNSGSDVNGETYENSIMTPMSGLRPSACTSPVQQQPIYNNS